MKFNQDKCKDLQLGQGNPKHKHRLSQEWIESSPEKKDLGVMVDKKLDMIWHCVLADQKDNHILGCIIRSTASRLREVIVLLPFVHQAGAQPSYGWRTELDYSMQYSKGYLTALNNGSDTSLPI
ncbi:hypothetical protein BTVI_155081 [Pitangus sulphuratus]|nr:hypothetical protein BTVI_155081 [Pitangus sulphuratus]